MDKLFKTFLDIISPPFCVGCGKLGSFVCTYCLQTIKLNECGECVVCLRPSIRGFTHYTCSSWSTPERFITPYLYEGVVKKAITRGKYEQRVFSYFEELTRLSFPLLHEKAFDIGVNAVVVPVPLHSSKKDERGFNQSDLIAGTLAQEYGLTICKHALSKLSLGEVQADLSRAQRLNNVSGVFRCDPAQIFGKDVLLVDDVCTTGATMLEASKELKRAGVRFVWCFALAKA